MAHDKTAEEEAEADRLEMERIRDSRCKREAEDDAGRRESLRLGISPKLQRVYSDFTDEASGGIRNLNPKMENRSTLRPYLESVTFRQLLGGTRRIAVIFAPFRMDLENLDVDLVRQDTRRYDLKITTNARQFSFFADGDRGMPFPMDDQGPWGCWIGSGAGNGIAYWHAEISYYPWELIGT